VLPVPSDVLGLPNDVLGPELTEVGELIEVRDGLLTERENDAAELLADKLGLTDVGADILCCFCCLIDACSCKSAGRFEFKVKNELNSSNKTIECTDDAPQPIFWIQRKDSEINKYKTINARTKL
jgi:hypothetical protein